LFVKLKKDKVLDQFVRGQIFGHIKTNPGTHYSEIKRIINVANGTLAYHLNTLEREEYIKSETDGNLKRFYPINFKIPQGTEGIKLSDGQIEIVKLVKTKPGLLQAEIAQILGKDRQLINYHVKQMIQFKILQLEKQGRETRCYLHEDYLESITKDEEIKADENESSLD